MADSVSANQCFHPIENGADFVSRPILLPTLLPILKPKRNRRQLDTQTASTTRPNWATRSRPLLSQSDIPNYRTSGDGSACLPRWMDGEDVSNVLHVAAALPNALVFRQPSFEKDCILRGGCVDEIGRAKSDRCDRPQWPQRPLG